MRGTRIRNRFNGERLARLVKARRGNRGLRAVALEIGELSPSTLSRVENGRVPDLETLLRLCDWLQIPAAELLEVTDTESTEAVGTHAFSGIELVPERVALQLRADKTLDEATAHALAEVVRAVYRSQNKSGSTGETQS